MSVKSGLQIIKVPVLANTNLSGLWIGNTTPITYLDVGTYLLTWNVACYPTLATDLITTSQFSITANQPYLSAGYSVVAITTILNSLGMIAQAGGYNELSWELMNVYTITANNTPIYAYQNCVLSTAGVLSPTHTWYNTVLLETNLNRVNIIRIS